MMSKLNRCVQHGQQLVALCVDQLCDRRVKAVCPLQLYNDHHNHKFQNLQKIYNQWGYIQRQMLNSQSNIDRNVVYTHMDQVIQQIIAHTRQHLLETRKDFQLKIDFYYDSKPVQKIGVGMRGIQKVLRQRFLELTQQQLESAKFFTEVYGMKKLVSDTADQKDRFIKQIVLSFAKLKEQMFLDYPKFQAMVKAKQFEYLQVIKQLRQSLTTVQTKFKQVNQRHGKVDQQLKQINYQCNKAKNQLRNKQTLLQQSSDKLRLITKKYNQQAQQAIQKSKAIMSKNIFQLANLKNIHRFTPRIVRVGDKDHPWPNFASAGKPTQDKLWLKINRWQVGSWVLIGLFRTKTVQKNQYQFDNYKQLGHGCYLMDNNRWSYSDHQKQNNCQPIGFQFFTNDVLRMQYFQGENMLRFSKMVSGWQQMRFQLKIKEKPEDSLNWCVAMKGPHTEVQIV